jgi:hypothetical protein
MRIGRQTHLRTLFAATVVLVFSGFTARAQTAGKETTLTGVVSDALCGARHSMKGMSAADCTRMCVKAGQSYALVVGNKVYNLSGHSPELYKYAGQKVAVKGKLSADKLTVDSVMPAK